MIQKTYRSRIHRTLSITGLVNQKRVTINFIDGNDKTKCVYTTKDADLQKFIESTSLFQQNLIYIESTITDSDVDSDSILVAEPTIFSKQDTPQESTNLIEKTFKNKQDLIEQITLLLPNAKTNKKMSNEVLIELAKQSGYLFTQE
ncbi:MAG: hypothetical protein Q4Q06_02930 [Bacteroidota bacterium]|nr:hypothetical protein [Bacteroidota bacterium]